MPFHSDKQRKAFFASRGNPRGNINPAIMNRMKPRLTPAVRDFVSKKIKKNIKEGKPVKQSIAIAFSQARKKFPKQKKSLTRIVGNPNSKLTPKRIVNLLVFLFGVSLALQILRSARK